MKAAELFVRCLENEGVEAVFGIPGEENVDIMDVLLDSSIRFITTRHEQGAAFMADVYGRLTGRAGVCLATLGPGATNLVTGVAAKLAFPNQTVAAVTGDAGFMMNSQEIETALRIGTPMVIVIWNDGGYGLIAWHQLRRFGRPSYADFSNPDFVKYAESFGAKGYRVRAADELVPILRQAIADDTVAVIDCPVDYSENMKLTERLGKLVCPV
jgi:thiamine pyrophosphate-dependent acetolactate synthase large subunit-like protein